jgi:hypothetical protein
MSSALEPRSKNQSREEAVQGKLPRRDAAHILPRLIPITDVPAIFVLFEIAIATEAPGV